MSRFRNRMKGDANLINIKMYINGEWRESSSKAIRDVINPANGEVIAQAAEGTLEVCFY